MAMSCMRHSSCGSRLADLTNVQGFWVQLMIAIPRVLEDPIVSPIPFHGPVAGRLHWPVLHELARPLRQRGRVAPCRPRVIIIGVEERVVSAIDVEVDEIGMS